MLQESSLGVRGRASLTCAGCVLTALASARARANCCWQSENPAMERELACGRHSCGRMTRLRARCLREQCSYGAASNGGGMGYAPRGSGAVEAKARAIGASEELDGCSTHLMDWG